MKAIMRFFMIVLAFFAMCTTISARDSFLEELPWCAPVPAPAPSQTPCFTKEETSTWPTALNISVWNKATCGGVNLVKFVWRCKTCLLDSNGKPYDIKWDTYRSWELSCDKKPKTTSTNYGARRIYQGKVYVFLKHRYAKGSMYEIVDQGIVDVRSTRTKTGTLDFVIEGYAMWKSGAGIYFHSNSKSRFYKKSFGPKAHCSAGVNLEDIEDYDELDVKYPYEPLYPCPSDSFCYDEWNSWPTAIKLSVWNKATCGGVNLVKFILQYRTCKMKGNNAYDIKEVTKVQWELSCDKKPKTTSITLNSGERIYEGRVFVWLMRRHAKGQSYRYVDSGVVDVRKNNSVNFVIQGNSMAGGQGVYFHSSSGSRFVGKAFEQPKKSLSSRNWIQLSDLLSTPYKPDCK